VESLPDGVRVVHLDTDPWELEKNYPTQPAILGDPKVTRPELSAAVSRAMSAADRERASRRLESARAEGIEGLTRLRVAAEAASGSIPIQPLALMGAVASMLPKNAVVIDETISSGAGLRRLLQSDDAQSFFGMRGGGIGWGLPAAIGAKLALPERPVVALIGDGSAMYTIQGL
jgi:benzoylformate decarboxylase